MSEKVLVTGGAGFVGSFIVDRLLEDGYEVRILDNLEPQVHGPERRPPSYLNPDAELIIGNMLDRETLEKALEGVDLVSHQAALVGVGQSMYDIYRYTRGNTLAGAVLLDILANGRHQVKKVVVASSMSIYGEGRYQCEACGPVFPSYRSEEQLEKNDWEMHCPLCAAAVKCEPTDETKPLQPTSVYAVNKRDHEEMFLAVGRAYGIPAVALRYFNIYGTRQALSNPYTGVAAIFSGRLLNGREPVIFEDGLQSRDFTHVSDIAEAHLLSLKMSAADFEVFNVGTGRSLTILDIAETLISRIAPDSGIKPVIENKFRAGDIRHCYADITKIRERLGFEPKVKFEDGIEELTQWVREQTAQDGYEKAREELDKRGLTQ